MKEKFLKDEFWVLTFAGGFQRANIYKEKIPEPVRKEFRNVLRQKIEALVEESYNSEVLEEQHIENIQTIVDSSKKNKIKGYTIPINFGVAQKLFNLYLKYLWCAGQLQITPTHFPVDRLIQGLLNYEAKKGDIQKRKLKAWTRFEDQFEYLEVIRFAEKVKDKNFKGFALAEMELELFTRR